MTYPPLEGTNAHRIAASVGQALNLTIKYYSNTDDSAYVKVYKTSDTGKVRQNTIIETSRAQVELNVFSKELKSPGWVSTIQITIDDANDLTEYTIDVINSVGSTSRKLEILKEGKCSEHVFLHFV